MKIVVACLFAFLSLSALGQSKKELEAQVKDLQTKLSQSEATAHTLRAELDALKKPKDIPIINLTDSASYGIGVLLGTNVRRQVGDTMNIDVLVGALNQVLLGQKTKMDESAASMCVQGAMQASMERRTKKIQAESAAFLAANKQRAGVVTTASGLQYEVIKKGNGKSPGATSSVTVHYTGTLVDGSKFDSSVDRGQPATFSLNEVIAGWTEGLQLMHEGDKWKLVVPAELGYGTRGSGAMIPPNAALVFEVELIKVN